jgi:phage regulator Rha-like protein
MSSLIPHERIQKGIFNIRGAKVMIDRDIAELYGVETRVLNQAVSRNKERFPDDFAFQLTTEEMREWMSQIVISNSDKMGLRKRPYAFTKHGILMLSNVLKSERAVSVSIQIIRVFAKMREMMQGYRELIERIQKIERRQDVESREIWKAIRLLQSTVMK